MNKIMLTCLLIITAISACHKIDDLLTFSLSNQATFTVPASSPLNLPLEILTPDIATNSSQQFQNNNTRADLVKDVKLDELKLTILNPSGKTFSFLKSVHIYISTNQNDEIELASQDNISSTASSLNLTTTKQKLDAYVKASTYKLRTAIVTRETLTQDIDVKADMKFKVTADAL
jgi:hypothetical protein